MNVLTRLLPFFLLVSAPAGAESYQVVVSRATADRPEWKAVADALVARHQGGLVVHDGAVTNALPALRAAPPRHVAFVARPAEAGAAYVKAVHGLVRKLDDDPYADALWGIVTGYSASNALAIVRTPGPLVVERIASGTELELSVIPEGKWFCELAAGKRVVKEKGGEAVESKGPVDSTFELVDALNEYKPQAFVTSGHATEQDWQIGFRYRNGSFRCKDGVLYGLNTRGERKPVHSPNPKVYLPVGNCLMGHISGPDCMALAWMNSAGVVQMAGYIEPTWFGYMGWGLLDLFCEQPGRYTCAEAFLANHHALMHRLIQASPEAAALPGLSRSAQRGMNQTTAGLLFDRDMVAFYGDPAFEARMAPGPLRWEQALEKQDGDLVLTITPKAGADTFKPVNMNGSQRGGRPVIHFLPRHAAGYEVVEGAETGAVAADDFVLVPQPGLADAARKMVVRLRPR